MRDRIGASDTPQRAKGIMTQSWWPVGLSRNISTQRDGQLRQIWEAADFRPDAGADRHQ
jgi:hypothetical protein